MMRSMKYLLTCALLSSAASAYASLDDIPSVTHPIQIKDVPIGMQSLTASPGGLSPQQVKIAYGINKVTNQGDGQTIAIILPFDNPFAEYDLGIFDTTYNLRACTTQNGCFNKVFANNVLPPPNNDWASESALDVEWAHAIAPNAKIMLVEAKSDSQPDLYNAIKVAVARGANIVSMSWVMAEGTWFQAFNLNSYFNVPNVIFVASAGDDGAGVNYPAASPYVVAVGGTSLSIDPKTGKRTSETAWSSSGGGLSKYELAPPQQINYPLPNNPQNHRGVPDVSYNADAYNNGFSVYNSNPNAQGQSGWFTVGGTSAGSPQWAAIFALANSIANKNIPVKSLLYDIAKKNYKMSFVDIKKGSNGTCGDNCKAQVNYDYITGLGAPHAKYLIDMLVKLS